MKFNLKDDEKRERNQRRIIVSFDTINFTFLTDSINAKKAYRKVYNWRNNNIFERLPKWLFDEHCMPTVLTINP